MSTNQEKGHENEKKDAAKGERGKYDSKDKSKLADLNGPAKKPKH